MKQFFFSVCLLLSLCGIARENATNAQPDPLPGKILFSASPFTGSSSAGKSSFTSNEFIYGRLELSEGSIKEAFKLRETTSYYFLICEVEVLKDGKPVGYHTRGNNYILLPKENLDKTWMNLDILPEPAQTTTLYSMTDDFSPAYYVPLYTMISPDYFPSAGNYHVNIRIFSRSHDAWDRVEPKDKWPFIEEGFDFILREADIATLKKNGQATQDFMEENAFRYDKLPDVFSNPGKLTDPNATTAKVAAILKRDLPNRAILKFVAEQYSGTLWHIATDEYSLLPKYKYFNPHIWMAYKADGKCYVGYVTLRQVYSGGGTYGPLAVAWTSTKDDKGIDCVKVK